LTALLVAAGLCPSVPADPPPGRDLVRRWIRELGDDDFQRRQEATKRLWEAGAAAEADLLAAANSSDPEVGWRARDVLDRFKWADYPDTPERVRALVKRYLAGDRGASQPIIKDLFECGSAGCKAVLKIYRAEEDAGLRRRLLALIGNELPRAVPGLMAEDSFDTLELVVEFALDEQVHLSRADDGRSAFSNYAAYWTLRGKLDERIGALQSQLRKSRGDQKAWTALAYLYRAKGDLAKARNAAEQSGRSDLVSDLLLEAGAWKELAGRPVGSETTHDAERLGLMAAYHRLAGDAKSFDDATAELRKLGQASKDDEGTAGLVAKSLFLNDRPRDALDLLVQCGDRALAFQVLVAQMKFAEAFKLVEAERAANGKQLAALEILAARTYCGLGQKEKALPVFARYGDRINADADATWFETLVESELRVGLKDEAFAHAARAMALSEDKGLDKRLLPKLFPNKAERAEAWWAYLRQPEPARDAGDVLKEIAELLRGKVGAREIHRLAVGAKDTLKTTPSDGADAAQQAARREQAEQLGLAIADAALAAGEGDLAMSTLEKIGTSAALVKLGDIFSERKQWSQAAERYRRAKDADRNKPLALFLWGRALAMAGQDSDGRRRMEQSHWLALGNEEARCEFADELARRGLTAASRREYSLLQRVSQPASYYSGEALRRQAVEARARQDMLRSADYEERSMLRCLHIYVTFVRPEAYVGVPALVHRQRAQGLLAAGQVDQALREADLCLDLLPGEVDVPITLMPGLVKAGRQKEAEALYRRVAGVFEEVARTYPKCGWCRNTSAWLSACCRRDLDSALALARKAVELEPETAGYYDTLAEVHFQRGEMEQAIAAQKKAIELDPKKGYYRKQLKRMEGGAATSPRPAEDDDDSD
jgi:tetratricopeptide (TPR) repeat protein